MTLESDLFKNALTDFKDIPRCPENGGAAIIIGAAQVNAFRAETCVSYSHNSSLEPICLHPLQLSPCFVTLVTLLKMLHMFNL